MSTVLAPMVNPAAKETTLKWVRGNKVKRHRVDGFTLIELLLVVTLIAVASGLATFALRNPAGTQLENEAARLAALLESARAHSRSTGIPVRWEPKKEGEEQSDGFRFVGLTQGNELPQRWLQAGVAADIVGQPAIFLGPEPLIGAQRIVLRLDDQRLILATDGLGPFEVKSNEPDASP